MIWISGYTQKTNGHQRERGRVVLITPLLSFTSIPFLRKAPLSTLANCCWKIQIIRSSREETKGGGTVGGGLPSNSSLHQSINQSINQPIN